MCCEQNRTNVWLINNHVDDYEASVREFLCHNVKCSTEAKASHNNRVVALLCETADRLFTLCVGLKFELAIFNACFMVLPPPSFVLRGRAARRTPHLFEADRKSYIKNGKICGGPVNGPP